ncbi:MULTISPECIES: ABC transporter ATP-binding protein [unclassified Treponema]|uniref:ABC transporter ATP-binding protein n=1 Tax=unclassified Treponema TaxID=2638727 RepID=UPI0020A5E07C|nr:MULTISPECIES: ABC transporter ATP-binding protein [unclassified Treponema]UTC67217.1 ABC transporter ATP-binding protein [Treponema sp. OMZ 789]UTC69946.1 ABC transporter ATP-binding protein [Treponema sp. OMZ 790]UTC72661.1 ABC transporter ATP-binding protein [Treponema sp. OMZ 791]
MELFNVKELNVGYNNSIILGNIEIELQHGQILCLMGPNGSGKSTIIKTITQHIKKLGGKIFIGGKDIEKLNNIEQAKKMSVVLTDRINPHLMTAEEIVATGRYPHTNKFGTMTEADHLAVDDAIKIVGGERLKHKEFLSLSDGEKQRIMIARAICQEADLMILDEPTSFLDIRYKIDLLGILRTLARDRNKIIILSLHELDLIPKIADKIVLILDKDNYLYGTPEEIISDTSICKAFDIKKGSYNTLLGNIELAHRDTSSKIFIIGGDGKGIPVYRLLNKYEITFNAGILFENDLDTPIAKALSIESLTQISFEPISDKILNDAKLLIEKSDIIIDCGASFSGINGRNLNLIRYAEELNKKILSLKERKEYKNYIYCNNFYMLLKILKEFNLCK